jgi:cardiolipin synthase
MSAQAKRHQRVIDQRHEILPPTWCPRPAAGAEAPIQVGRVRRSDPSRRTAHAIVKALDGAVEVVVVMSFLLADEPIEQALLRAAKRGVRVYVLLATETRLDREPREDSEFEQAALAQHKAMLDKLAGWVLLRSAPGYHAKVVLVDPAKNGAGFLLTSNLTREALTQNEELAVELTAAECKAVWRHLAWAMWEAAEHELLEPRRLLPIAGPSGLVPRPHDTENVVVTPMEAGTLRSTVLARIRSARESIVVASFGWGLGHEVLEALTEKAAAGVSVTVLARIRRTVMPALLSLAESGARVLGYRLLHAKALLVDDRDALLMTANLEEHGLDDSFELGVHLDAERSAGVAAILRAWKDNAPFELRPAPRLGEILGDAEVWAEERLIPFRVVASETRGLPDVAAGAAGPPEPLVPRGRNGLPAPAHEIVATWDVVAPRAAPPRRTAGPV